MALGAGRTATLEDIPAKVVELEEYVAALFQASRHFVGKQVVEREPEAEIRRVLQEQYGVTPHKH